MNLFNDSKKNSSSKLDDRNIALDMLKDSKFSINALAMATSEAINPQLRQILDTQLVEAVNEHHELSDIAINKSWYEAYEEPKQQLKDEIIEAKRLVSNDQE